MAVRVVVGENDLATTHPHLLEEWDYDANDKSPDAIVAGSTYRAHWVCKKGHTWTTAVRKRGMRGQGCPYCAGQKPVPGINDLGTLYPALAKEWSERNSQMPQAFLPSSGKKAWWVCQQGHEWEAVIETRTKRGYGCPFCSGRMIQYGKSVASHPVFASQWSSRNTDDPAQVGVGTAHRSYYWECAKGHTWKTSPYNRKQGKGCPKCIDWATSRGEKSVQRYVRDILPEDVLVVQNTKSVISPLELDIYIPSMKVAIEFNGLYWHSTLRQKDKHYHLKKVELCEQQGIRLLQVWEDDWRDKPEVVKAMLARKLGVSREPRVNARDAQVVSVSREEALSFLADHHIQGGKNCSVTMGLEIDGDLVCVLGATQHKEYWLIERFASKAIVRGGFGKLLRHLRTLTSLPLVTFADKGVSDGTLYEKLGFFADQVLPPDYCYVYKGRRCHKFGFRKTRFKNDPDLLYEKGLTERSLAELNGIPRIYDSGKVRYVLAG